MRVLRLLIAICLIGSCLNLIPIKFWLIETNSNFGAYYLCVELGLLIALPFFARHFPKREFWFAVVGLLAFIFYYAKALVPFYFYKGEEVSPKFKIFYANVFNTSRNKDGLRQLILEENPEVLILIEPNEEWIKKLGVRESFPFKRELLGYGDFSMALYSRLEMVGDVRLTVGEDLPPVIVQDLKTAEGVTFTMMSFHLFPPLSQEAMRINELVIRRLGTLYRHGKELIVVADMNATPFASFYRRFVNAAQVRNAMHGFGIKRTWNAWSPFLRLTIDHMFVRGKISVQSFKRLDEFGSDHFPLVAEVGIEKP